MTITMNARLGLGVLAVSAAFLSAPTAWAEPADPAIPTPTVIDTNVPAAAPAPVEHLSSPDNLPPGTTSVDTPPQGRLGYWRDLLHAMRTQEVSGSDALLLLTQRPLDASTPPPGVPAGPTGPVGTSALPPAVDPGVPVPVPAG